MSKKNEPSDDAALQARLAQLELENRICRQQQDRSDVGGVGAPRRGFGSAHGIAHLRHSEYQRRGPTPVPPPPAVPAPGKARFGGTYLQTPLPGVIAPGATPGNELICPTPAAVSDSVSHSTSPPRRIPVNLQSKEKPSFPSSSPPEPVPTQSLRNEGEQTIDTARKADLSPRKASEQSLAADHVEKVLPLGHGKGARLKRFKNPTLGGD